MTLHLTIATPEAAILDAPAVAAVRAEDDSGSFGVWPGHADLITALPPSVVQWRGADGVWRFCAVRGGVLTVHGGDRVAIAAREAHVGDRLDTLAADIRQAREADTEATRRASVDATRLHAVAVRRLMACLVRDPGAGDLLGEATL